VFHRLLEPNVCVAVLCASGNRKQRGCTVTFVSSQTSCTVSSKIQIKICSLYTLDPVTHRFKFRINSLNYKPLRLMFFDQMHLTGVRSGVECKNPVCTLVGLLFFGCVEGTSWMQDPETFKGLTAVLMSTWKLGSCWFRWSDSWDAGFRYTQICIFLTSSKWSVHIFLAKTCSCITYVGSQLVGNSYKKEQKKVNSGRCAGVSVALLSTSARNIKYHTSREQHCLFCSFFKQI